ncbi:manganese efflux pump [Halobacillus locisalis]|uniref:Putative manganese efflux pump MntP n=1 Tax=Halobacillus locisalis TaxID=220753 RepID=A0A838CTQ7_9BACI|nr:manganese efflux pump MntP family protein [Halobacillus locisalis]MBA2175263.1 manganese efflux pump [Halobacillus locisalis]
MEQVTSLVLLSIALGLDAFSVSLGMGMQSVRLKHAFIAGIVVGIAHIVMPGLGMLLGQWMSSGVSQWATVAGGAMLFGLGSYTVFASLTEKHSAAYTLAGAGLWLFALSVSIDSFPVGFSLGLRDAEVWVSVLSFGLFSMALTWAGFVLGRRAGALLGTYSELLGGSILCALGLNAIF